MELAPDFSKILFSKEETMPSIDEVLFWQDLENRILYLETDINWENVSHIIRYIKLQNRRSLDRTTPILLNIYSGGGDLSAMWPLITAIEDSEIPVFTHNIGHCASAAFLVFLAGHHRTMTPNSFFIAHEGSGSISGNFKETKSAMAMYNKEVEKMTSYMSSRTNLSVEDIKARFDNESDWYIDEAAAQEFGIINTIGGEK